MSAPRKVAVVGATGNVGPSLIQGLANAGYEVSVLSRSETFSQPLPDKARIVKIDWAEPLSLSAAIKNHYAVVSALPMDPHGTRAQHAIIDACLATGVPRFIPSSFGSDFANARVSQLPAYAGKVAVGRRLEELAQAGKLSYIDMSNGPFLDWCIMVGLFVDPKNHKVTYFDGGDVPFSSTTLASVGRAVGAALDNWEKVKNRIVRVQDAVVTQKQLVEAAKKVQNDGVEWEIEYQDTEPLEQEARKNFVNGNPSNEDYYAHIKRAIWGEGHGAEMTNLDNDILGLPQMSKEEVQQVVARYC